MAGLMDFHTLTLRANRHLAESQQVQARMTERASSGLRVNSARDDAAGLSIADRLNATVRSNGVLTRTLMDGISLVQVADSGLERITQALQRARELAVQAANGTATAQDRAALDLEFQQHMAQIDLIASSNQAFGVHLLRGAEPATNTPSLTHVFPASGTTRNGLPSGAQSLLLIPAGATNVQIDINSFSADDDLQVFTTDGKHLVGTPLGDKVWTTRGITNPAQADSQLLTAANGFGAGASYDASALLDGSSGYVDGTSTPLSQSVAGMTLSYSGDGDHADGSSNDGSVGSSFQLERFHVDTVTQPLLVMVVGSGVFDATATWDSLPTANTDTVRKGPVDVVLRSDFGEAPDIETIGQMPSDTATLGLSTASIDDAATAQAAMDAIDTALQTVSGYRGAVGAATSRFERVTEQLTGNTEALTGARSRIMDADMAATMAMNASAMVRSNAGQAMLSQANAAPKQVLDMLLGGMKSGG